LEKFKSLHSKNNEGIIEDFKRITVQIMAENLLVKFYLFFGNILNDQNPFLVLKKYRLKYQDKKKKTKKIMCVCMIKLKVT
jgi:hypothetical protein